MKSTGKSGHAPLTPVVRYGGWWAKRDDLAERDESEPDSRPSGAKVRQFLGMAKKHPKGTPLVVGCSAVSLMQVYLADAAVLLDAPAFVFVPKRGKTSHATRWTKDRGAKVVEVSPGYPSVYRLAARRKMEELGWECIRWDVRLAVQDAALQTDNLPADVRRVVVPTGSGLVAAGILVGLADAGRQDVAVVCVLPKGGMAREEKIIVAARGVIGEGRLPPLEIIVHDSKYARPKFAELPDGTLLDPSYAAKALDVVRPGDCLWVTGCRPRELIERQRKNGGE